LVFLSVSPLTLSFIFTKLILCQNRYKAKKKVEVARIEKPEGAEAERKADTNCLWHRWLLRRLTHSTTFIVTKGKIAAIKNPNGARAEREAKGVAKSPNGWLARV
jgi:hypothetical protein